MSHFQRCLEQSHSAADLPLWEEVYRTAFPSFQGMFYHEADGYQQRQGVDRSVTLLHSKQILVDEKARGINKITGKVYKDIALEYRSDDARHTPGWVCKPLQCDYIAYAIIPLGKCYLLPVIQLQAAWEQHEELWFSKMQHDKGGDDKPYYDIRAKNDSWWTRSIGIPVDVLYRAMGNMLRINFEPIPGYRE